MRSKIKKQYEVICSICNKPFIHYNKIKQCCDDPNCKKQIQIIKNQNRLKTNLLKYGTEHPMRSQKCKDKSKETFKEKYGTEHPMKNLEICTKVHNNLKEQFLNKIYSKICPICSVSFETKIKKQKYCSDMCKDKSEILRVQKIQNTLLNRYGVINYSQTNDCKTKVKNTWLNKSPEELEEIKQKHIQHYQEKYGVDYFVQTNEFKEAFKNTCLERYGVENVFQSEIIKNKIKQTCIDTFGVDHYMKSAEGRQQISEIHKNRSPEDKQAMVDKNINTCLERYEAEHPLQNEEIYQKMMDTNLEKYGVENVFQSEIIKDKIKQIIIDKYGVENAMHNKEIFIKHLNSCYSSKNYTLPSGRIIKIQGYEDRYLDEYFKNKKLESDLITQGDDMPQIFYTDKNNVKHRYYPDFYIISTNTIIEVKSDYTYNFDLEINLLKEEACKNAGYNFEFKIY